MKKFATFAAILSASVGFAGSVLAANVNIPVGWDVEDQPGISVGSYFSTSWLATQNEVVRVTGLYALGNNYTVYDNGVQVAPTTAAPDWTSTGNGMFGAPYTIDPNVAWATAGFAHVMFNAQAGDLITIKIASLPTNFYDGAVAVGTTPLPATWLMLLSGLLGLGALGYRRSPKHARVGV